MSDPALLLDAIRRAAGELPETCEESPWGELVVKVRKKVFVFLGRPGDALVLSLKLPESGPAVLARPGAEPTGYGLGRHGWVTIRVDPGTAALPELLAWVEESYRAVAPKSLVKRMGAAPAPGPAPRRADAGPPEVVVIGADPLRTARAVDGLAALGIRALAAPADDACLELIADAPLRAVVLDAGRAAVRVLDLAGKIGLLTDAPLALAGLRDASAERRAREALPTAGLHARDAPGSPAFTRSFADWLARAHA